MKNQDAQLDFVPEKKKTVATWGRPHVRAQWTLSTITDKHQGAAAKMGEKTRD